MSVKRLGNKKYEIRGTVTLSTGKYHRYSFRKTDVSRLLIPSMMRVSLN